MSNFKIGQKVVCVEPVSELVLNQIYTIRLIRTGIGKEGFGLGVHLKEITKSIAPTGKEWCFDINRFRPLDHQFAEDVIAMITELETVDI